MKNIFLMIISILLLVNCSAIRKNFLEIEKKENEHYKKYVRGERPLVEVDFNGYVEKMVYFFYNYYDDQAIKYIDWYPAYHSQLLNSFKYGVIINLFAKKSKHKRERYTEFVDWYKNLIK